MKLSILPSDVIRNIILVGLESVDEIKLIAPRWNTLVNDHLSNRKNLPRIECLHLETDLIGIITIRLHIAAKFRSYFGVENCSFRPLYGTAQHADRRVEVEYLFMEDSDFLFKCLTRLSARCSSICKIKFGRFHNQNEIGLVKSVMGNLDIGCVEFIIRQFNEGDKESILDGIKCLGIQSVILSEDNTFLIFEEGLREFLTDALNHASKVEICAVEEQFIAADNDKILEWWNDQTRDFINDEKLKSTVGIRHKNGSEEIIVSITVTANDD